MILFIILLLTGFINPVFAATPNSPLPSTAVAIPGGEGGIGFDDMTFSSSLHKVLIPAGHTGKLYLIDPSTYVMTAISGFSSSAKFQKGHDTGITSADEGEGFLFVLDHGRQELAVVDLKSSTTVATVKLAGDSDYVRYMGTNHEVWVTEPHNKQIEVFKFSANRPTLFPVVRITVHDGPESLMVDHIRGKAYTNLGRQAGAIDLASHAIVATWPNECEKSRGDALDESKGLLFVSCAEGKAVVFDLNQEHKEISNLITDPGADVISYNTKLSHLYLTSSKNATLTVLGVSAKGELSLLAQAKADQRAHCVVGDDQNNIWVCDPPRGQLLRFKDSL
jgi:hypothetical protein